MAAGCEHSLFLSDDGTVYAVGAWRCRTVVRESHSFELAHTGASFCDCPWVRILAYESSDSFVTLAVRRFASLFLTAGTDSFGQCGLGFEQLYVRSPVPLRGALEGKRVVRIAAGDYTSFAITEGGEVWAWGSNREGALGHRDRTDVGTPRLMQLPADVVHSSSSGNGGSGSGAAVVDVAAGGGHTLLLLSDGRLLAVGRGRSGQLGSGAALESVAACRTVPRVVSGLEGSTVIGIAAGRDHSLALVK